MSSTANASMWTAVSYLIMERVSNGMIREVFGAFIGISMVYYFTGWKLLYSLIIVGINILLLTFVKNGRLPLYSFFLTFMYLGVLRVIHLFGLPPLIAHANAVQLIMTLRLVGLSFEVEDSRRKHAFKYDQARVRFIVEPNWWRTFFYAYNFPGLFTGPYYTYAMHRDVVDNNDVMEISVWSEVRWRLWNLAWALPAFIILVYAFPLQVSF
ncbi:Lysophospholipid acyltransferase 7 [Toxocara canis]|uniref:Lysophospholipid acyltransferase 7 n=1 Tax=Toxocara canis TaxID=6265 RepID=A0A0B2VPR2_TOXCA|nr:Lysophospholipid acyltransferase 7 [Toxocara canis]